MTKVKLLSASILFSAFFLVGLFVLSTDSEAAVVYLTPTSGSVQSGNNIELNVRLNTEGSNVAHLQLVATFDTNRVDEAGSSYTKTSTGLSDTLFMSLNNGRFSIQQFAPLQTDSSGNPIPVVPVNGDVYLGKLTLKTTGGAGSLVINVPTGTGNTTVYNNDAPAGSDPALPVTGQGSTYTITGTTNPPPPPPPPPPPTGGGNPPPPPTGGGNPPPPPPTSGGSSGGSSSSSGGSTGTSSGSSGGDGGDLVVTNSALDTKKPTISSIKVTNVTESSVVIEWTTDEVATSYVEYGETTTYGNGEGDAKYTKNHKITISRALQPTTTYNFRVLSTDQAGNTAISKDQDFTTKPPVSVQRTYRYIGLAMIIGGLLALAIIAFYYFRKKGPHPDNLTPDSPTANLNPPI